MGSDRARRSYDPTRRYRSVVSQQGRVTVEADANEAEEIRAAEARADLVDVIGPSGSPDDGYKITLPSGTATPFDLAIGLGTIYVGGVRIEQSRTGLTYDGQATTEWLDGGSAFPLPYAAPNGAFRELVWLEVAEQEVGAVEDPVLRDVALGGPDTAARTRMIPRVERARVDAPSCQDALATVVGKTWAPARSFDPATMRLASTQQLKVGFVPVTGTGDPCQPIAQAGFLGAENQLVRVQVAADGATMLWGYDDASFVYRVTVDTTGKTLSLASQPVDAFHQPRIGQVVEVLACTVDLGSGSYVASPVGVVGVVDAYDPSGPSVTLQAALPAALLTSPPPQLFLRVWESAQPFPTDAATATELLTAEGHGIGVLVWSHGTARVPGDYWLIGLRPSAPTTILPARLTTFQPPDGPTRWAVPLSVVSWHADHQTADITDCRHHFKNLVELTEEECGCELLLSPGDDLQAKVDALMQANESRGIGGLHVKLASGVFQLAKPLVFDAPKPRDLTISGCGLASVVRADGLEVAIVMRGWSTASVFDLAVETATAGPGHGKKLRLDVFPNAAGDELRHLGGALTFLDCGASVIERVNAACGAGLVRAASCITVRSHARGATARVRSCSLWPGPRQIGALFVDIDRVTAEDNQIRLNPNAPLADASDDVALKRALIDSVQVAPTPANAISVRKDLVRAPVRDGVLLSFTANPALHTAWTRALATLDRRVTAPGTAAPAAKPTNLDRKLVQRRIQTVVRQVLEPNRAGPLTVEELVPFRTFIANFQKGRTVAAGQGIVVAGEVASDVRILNNTMAGVMDGVHVGLSTRNKPHEGRDRKTRAAPLSAERVQVIGNTIAQRVPRAERGMHAGIFIGNVNFATVRDNHVDGDTAEANRRGDGIRLWGVMGPFLLVSGNSCQHADVGIRVKTIIRNVGIAPGPQWRLTQNFVLDAATRAIWASGFVTVGDDNVTA